MPRSLYWRIAIGFVVFLAAMLVIQAMLFTWVIARSGRTLPGETPGRFADTVALDLASALQRDPHVDLAQYVRDQYAQAAHPFFVVLTNGSVITSGPVPISEPMLRFARMRLRRRSERADLRDRQQFFMFRPDRPDRSDRIDAEAPMRLVRPIVVNGETAGVVVVPPRAPFTFLLRRFAPTLGVVAVGVLLLGTAGAALVIFGPARRRLRGLEIAARHLGSGDLSARAPVGGGDEISAVATAFNQMADDLATSDRVRRQLLADVSHELTTPVTAMRGYLETLTMPELVLDDSTRARYLAIIGDETARLEKIIGDLLDLARLEGGGGTFAADPVEVPQLFARVAARHEPALMAANVRLTDTVAPDAATVVGDRDRLEQALQNLAANAIRYAPPGSAIHLDARRDGGDVVIAVSDEGPGIAPEHLPHVFDRFYKVDAARSGGASSGSGLGLSIAKAIVERHGGRIAASSRPGRTVFEIRLPATRPDVQAPAAPRPAPRPGSDRAASPPAADDGR